jgi:hypothetical protein
MGKRCSIYIDEAGDLGVKRGTRWFVLSAIAVNEEDEPQIRTICQSLKSYLNLNTIHFIPSHLAGTLSGTLEMSF